MSGSGAYAGSVRCLFFARQHRSRRWQHAQRPFQTPLHAADAGIRTCPLALPCPFPLDLPCSPCCPCRPAHAHPVAVARVLAGVGVLWPHLAAHQELVEHRHEVAVLADDVVHQAAVGGCVWVGRQYSGTEGGSAGGGEREAGAGRRPAQSSGGVAGTSALHPHTSHPASPTPCPPPSPLPPSLPPSPPPPPPPPHLTSSCLARMSSANMFRHLRKSA